MISLDSDRWLRLTSSVGGDGTLAAQLLRQLYNGREEHYAELQHQACHQFQLSGGNVAYALAPHLVNLASGASPVERVVPLSIVGNIVAARCTEPTGSPPVPSDLASDLESAISQAKTLALHALQNVCDLYDSQQLIATITAIQGLGDLAMHLFISGPELSCPECGEYISFKREQPQNVLFRCIVGPCRRCGVKSLQFTSHSEPSCVTLRYHGGPHIDQYLRLRTCDLRASSTASTRRQFARRVIAKSN